MFFIENLMNNDSNKYRTLHWQGDTTGSLWLLDQTLLPLVSKEIECTTTESVWEAIRALRVRGAPAIGVSAAYGVVIGLQSHVNGDRASFNNELKQVTEYLASSRPTAVNLFWALDRMQQCADANSEKSPQEMLSTLLQEAEQIENEDQKMCKAIGKVGAKLINDGDGLLTHCNAGGLATAGQGTALSLFFEAAAQGKQIHVFADETRPLLQGARLTTWELMQYDIPVTLICDNMAGQVMKEGKIQAVVTGADRIAANGDAANKIGTYSVALLAKAHDLPFYIAAPSSTFDMSLPTGDNIPIEIRDSKEVTHGFGNQTAPEGVNVYSPAFDVTPADLIAGIVTEKGLIQPVTTENVLKMLSK